MFNKMLKYLPTIGMEVHAELATKSKMFCACANGLGLGGKPNKNICPVCTGQPGSLQWLRSEGYETFDQHLLEPYDMIMNGEQRLDAIVNNTKFWMKEIPEPVQVRQKIEHNFKRAVAQAQEYETVLKNLITEFDIQAVPEHLVPTIDK